LHKKTEALIKDLLVDTVRSKLSLYEPETGNAPFHYRLLGQDRYAIFSFIQSMNTTFGMSIWEQVAEILAQGAGKHAQRQYDLLGKIDAGTEKFIQKLHHNLRTKERRADFVKDILEIKNMVKPGAASNDPDKRVDLYVKDKKGEYFYDITSVKPNMKEFVSLKLKLLRWAALRYSQGKDVPVYPRLGIPFNPYHPEPYNRWTLGDLFDLKANEVLIGDEFWNEVAGEYVYPRLLDIFEVVGKKLRKELDKKFASFVGGKVKK
jgi:hypothetical protein